MSRSMWRENGHDYKNIVFLSITSFIIIFDKVTKKNKNTQHGKTKRKTVIRMSASIEFLVKKKQTRQLDHKIIGQVQAQIIYRQ